MTRPSLLLAAAILLSQTSVAEASERHRLSIAGGRLGDAIVALGRQAGIGVGITDSALAELPVRPTYGRMTAEQALRHMLRGTGARPVAVDAVTFRIVRDARPRPQPRPPAPAVLETTADAIIVTGAKRAIRLAAYPGAVEMVTREDPLLADQMRGSDALVARLPTVTSTHLGPGRNKLFLRGIADSSFNGPTQATVGQYLGEMRLNYNAPDPDLRLYDVERVEILAGPQGTLYGAGSLGGIIRIVPARPRTDMVEGLVSAGVSATWHGDPGGDAGGVLNLPLAEDRIGVRLVGYGASEGGYIDDLLRGQADVNRTRIAGGRASIRGETGDGWTIDLGGAFQTIRGEAQFADRDAPRLTRRSPVAQDFGNDYGLADLTLAREWGDMRFVAATGIVRQTLNERYDSTRDGGPPTVFDQTNRITLLSAETRLSRQSPGGDGWLVGSSFIRNVSEQNRALGAPERPAPITGVRNALSEATLFGEASLALRPSLVATAGGRITHSRLSGSALDVPAAILMDLRGIQASRSQTAFLPSFALSARAMPDLLLFARYQQAFRPGGLAVSGPVIQRFERDSVATLEAGFRYGRAGAGAFDAALSFAYTRWDNVQADIVDLVGMPTTANIGDGRIYTIDARLGWRPIAAFGIEVAGAYNDSLVTNPLPNIVIAHASPLPNVARWNGRVAADYRARINEGVDLRLNAAARYVGRSRLGIGAVLGESQGNWLDVSAGARLEKGDQALTLGVTNLLDSVGNRFALGSPFLLVEQRHITPLRPRTVRIGLEHRF